MLCNFEAVKNNAFYKKTVYLRIGYTVIFM